MRYPEELIKQAISARRKHEAVGRRLEYFWASPLEIEAFKEWLRFLHPTLYLGEIPSLVTLAGAILVEAPNGVDPATIDYTPMLTSPKYQDFSVKAQSTSLAPH